MLVRDVINKKNLLILNLFSQVKYGDAGGWKVRRCQVFGPENWSPKNSQLVKELILFNLLSCEAMSLELQATVCMSQAKENNAKRRYIFSMAASNQACKGRSGSTNTRRVYISSHLICSIRRFLRFFKIVKPSANTLYQAIA
jgi:hypothetical protein